MQKKIAADDSTTTDVTVNPITNHTVQSSANTPTKLDAVKGFLADIFGEDSSKIVTQSKPGDVGFSDDPGFNYNIGPMICFFEYSTNAAYVDKYIEMFNLRA